MHAPQFPRRVSVAEVVHNARCELYEAVSQNIHDYPWIERWSVAFNFAFTVDRHMDASADTTYLIPVQYGTFSLGIDASLDQNAKGTFVVNFSITNGLGHFAEADCLGLRARAETPRRLLNGEIGLRRWLNEVIPQLEDAWIAPESAWEPESRKARRIYAGKADQIGYTIEFGVTATGNLLPGWDLTYLSGRRFRPTFDFGLSRIVTHKLIVAMTPIAPLPPLDLTGIHTTFDGKDVIMGRRVCVTNVEQSGLCFFDNPALRREMDETAKKLAENKRKMREAEAAKSAAVKKNEDVTREYKGWLQKQSQSLREAERPNFLAESEEQIMANSKLAERHVLLGLKKSQTQANSDLEDAIRKSEKAAAAIADLEARQQAIRAQAREYQAVGREAAAQAMDRARQQAREQTEQRLQQIIQDQIIRDAFRR